MKLIDKLMEQKNIKGIGDFLNVLYLTSPLFGMVMYVVNASTFYVVWRVPDYLPWMSFRVFVMILILTGLLAVFLFYKFVYPSYQTMVNKQTYKHQNPIVGDIKEIKEKTDRNTETLEYILKLLGKKTE